MKWIEGEHPKKTEFTGIIGSKRYLLRFRNNQMSLYHWLGDRFNNLNSGGNKVTHYMLIETVPDTRRLNNGFN